jgi:hypothetical protein
MRLTNPASIGDPPYHRFRSTVAADAKWFSAAAAAASFVLRLVALFWRAPTLDAGSPEASQTIISGETPSCSNCDR